MTEPRMYNGRPLKANVQVKTEVIDGETKEILVMPAGQKSPYADEEEKKVVKKTVKANPQKESILSEVIETLRSFSDDGNVYRTKENKYAIITADGKWFSLALTANKSQPKELTKYEPQSTEQGE